MFAEGGSTPNIAGRRSAVRVATARAQRPKALWRSGTRPLVIASSPRDPYNLTGGLRASSLRRLIASERIIHPAAAGALGVSLDPCITRRIAD